jgi:hypothetical protein
MNRDTQNYGAPTEHYSSRALERSNVIRGVAIALLTFFLLAGLE